jgi:thiamine-phosphate pyrophosphorylase
VRGLYPIVDVGALSARGLPIAHFAKQVLAVKPRMLQLRAKLLNGREMLAVLQEIRPLCRAAGTLLFANDRADLALLAECDGVHVGQDDLSIREVRRFAPSLRVGISTHSLDQLEKALAERPDYVAFGPVYETRSKDRPDPTVGLDGLAAAGKLCAAAGCPLVAIGGIDRVRAAEIATRATFGAVIADLLPEGDRLEEVGARARALHEALGGDQA